jgi:hypothetical protein
MHCHISRFRFSRVPVYLRLGLLALTRFFISPTLFVLLLDRQPLFFPAEETVGVVFHVGVSHLL